MKFETRSKVMVATIFLAFAFLAILVCPRSSLGQELDPEAAARAFEKSAFGERRTSVPEGARRADDPSPVHAPKREAQGREKMIVTNSAAERRERENAEKRKLEKAPRDPTFDGSALFAGITPKPSATPSRAANPVASASPSATGQPLEISRASPIPSASAIPNAPKSLGASPGPSATGSPHN